MSRLIDLQCDADHIDNDETWLRIARGRLGGRDWSQLMLIVMLIEVMLIEVMLIERQLET
jgi:ABC-type enterobactin transport system permease subunit